MMNLTVDRLFKALDRLSEKGRLGHGICAIHLATTIALIEGMLRDISQGKDIQGGLECLEQDLKDLVSF
jgi:hypothetical protein